MKTQFKQVDIDEVYDLQNDMQEMFDQHSEIQEALSRTYETPEVGEGVVGCAWRRILTQTQGFDDEALEAELDALEDMELEEEPPAWLSELPSVAPVPAQPTAPQHADAVVLK